MSLDLLKSFPLVYVASPYSKYPTGIDCAFVEASRLTGELARHGVRGYSPIAHTHSLARYANIDPYSYDIWLPFDEAIMAKSDAMTILKMEGWDKSFGINHEIDVFRAASKPIFVTNVNTFETVQL